MHPVATALAGIGQSGLRGRLHPEEGGVRDESLAFFAGTLQQRTLSAKQLEQLLRRYLGVAVKLEQFVGRWYSLPEEACWSLGLGNGMLGRNAIAGDRVWQRDLCVRIVLGPLDRGAESGARNGYGLLVRVLAYCGLRWGELSGLRVSIGQDFTSGEKLDLSGALPDELKGQTAEQFTCQE